ncbi:hypothetical protein M0M57_08105 [Flavobacterium azooxidireducens]|uniref:MORN repeat protein n=1 Tax=Flavobacterium azooxidireducens TaxID=1871076 RepID=A0ABY4KK71_9FLAO|nr:hypothetical protein [Flavobacterium azooxidireducens]UPQ80790.1 hypothetical protein M0M57_08105 [Flavobacterium azooxidireducens]
MRKIITLLLLFVGLQNSAQSMSDGIYSTNFGTINLTFEVGYEYPNGGMVYGDYKNNGTITGSTTNNGKEIIGTFHNGAAEGKFIFFAPSGKQHFFDSGITSFNGNWGYGTDNKYSTNTDHIWKATSKTSGKDAIKNVTNVWSGKWNTTDGNLILQQVGNKITGTYKGIGTVTAIYSPQTKKLKGTFYNNNTKKTGHFEFNFEGNSFKGKWGWTSAMTDGVWNGDKHIKNNKELPKSTTQVTSSTSNSGTTKFVVSAVSIDASEGKIYGFFGCKLFKVTASGREQVQNFGNKSSDFYNTTENNENKLLSKKQAFSNSPEFYREFVLNNSDLNNNGVKYELEIYSHMKAKRTGASNLNFGFIKEIFRLDQIKIGETFPLISIVDGVTIFGGGQCILKFKVTKS